MAVFDQTIENAGVPNHVLQWYADTIAPSLIDGVSKSGTTVIVHWNISPSQGQQDIATNLAQNWDQDTITPSNGSPTIADTVTYSNVSYANGSFAIFNATIRKEFAGTLDGNGEVDVQAAIADTYDVVFIDASNANAAHLQIVVTES